MGWLIALGILVLLAILPLGAAIRYNSEGFSVKLIAGPVRIQVMPGKKKDKSKHEKPKKKQQKKKTNQSVSKQTAKPVKEKGGPITDFLPIVETALDLLNGLRKKLRVKQLNLKLVMAADDPCDLAVNYGRANAAMGNLLPMLEHCLVIRKRDIQVACDFEASETVILADAQVTITLGWLLSIVVFYGIRGLRQFLQIKNKRKGGKLK